MAGANSGDWSGSNARWYRLSDGGNLAGCPADNSILRFDNTDQPVQNQNCSIGFPVYRIYFDAGTVSRTFDGNSIRFFDFGGADPRIENNDGDKQIFNLEISGDGDVADPLELSLPNGDIDLNGIIKNQGSPINVTGNNSRTLTISGVISGPGTFSLLQNSNVVFTAQNTYTGLTTVTAGTLRLSRTGGNSISVTNNILINGGVLQIKADQTINNLTLSSGSLEIDAGVTLTINGLFTGGGTIVNNGTLILNNTSNFPDGSTVSAMNNFQVTGSGKTVTLTAGLSVSGDLVIGPAAILDVDAASNYSVTVSGNISINTGAALLGRSATITVGGNWNNGGTYSWSGGNTIIFNGTGNHTIITGGTGAGKSFINVTFNGSGTTWALLNNNMSVNGTLNFLSGKLDVNGNTLLLGSSSILGSYGVSSYVITSNGTKTGFVRGAINSPEIFIFPVGTSLHYMPVQLGNSSSNEDFSVRAYAPPTMNGVPGSGLNFYSNELDNMVQAIWNINRNTASTDNVNVTFWWQQAQEGSTFSSLGDNEIGISRYTGSAWTSALQSSGANGIINRVSATFNSFSPFGVGRINAVLPIKITNFRGELKNNTVLLNWSTLYEEQSKEFEIQRAGPDGSFMRIGRVNANGISNQPIQYYFTDNTVLTGINLYRLNAIELDGKNYFSSVIRIQTNGPEREIIVYQNHGSSSITIIMNRLPEGEVEIRLLNMTGQSLAVKKGIVSSISQSESLEYPSSLPGGIYIVQVRGKDYEKGHQIFIR